MQNMKRKIFRIIDANFNRAREGLRVCEEVARFLLDSPSLTKDYKSLRHALDAIIGSLPLSEMIASRDSRHDVGKGPTCLENLRRNHADILRANLGRVKESLRVLEEFLKLTSVKQSNHVKALRFKVYEIEQRSIKKLETVRNTG